MNRTSVVRPRAASGLAVARGHQTTIFERLEGLARAAETHDPRGPATALFCIVLALMALGLMVQASHAATIMAPEEFQAQLASQVWFRGAGLVALLSFARLGPAGVRRFIPALCVLMAVLLCLVWAPGIGSAVNGSHRWLNLGLFSFQPSELARIVVVLWAADRCVRLGPAVTDLRRGVLPMLAVGLFFFGLVAAETDIGGALLLLLCLLATMWIGGARLGHVGMTLISVGAGALVLGYTCVPYVHRRIEMFFGHIDSHQVSGSLRAMQNGGCFGTGVADGSARNLGVPYLESDFVFAQVGEELGLFGLILVIGLFVAFLWQGLRLVVSIRDRYEALASFGLLIATALQAMLHMQVVAKLVPPKGMTLPFISHGGTSLVVSCIGIGLALGAAARGSVNESLRPEAKR